MNSDVLILKLKKWGNSYYLLVPRDIIRAFGWNENTYVRMKIIGNGELELREVRR